MQTVAETSLFIKQANKLFSPAEKIDVINYIAAYAETGDIIQGAGGVRKLRVPAKGKGKRGGAVILYVYSDNAPIYALLVYPKNQIMDLSADDKRAVKAFAKTIKDTQRS